MTPPRLVLASASPRRRALLRQLAVPFTVRPSGLPEEGRDAESPRRRAERLSLEKAQMVASSLRRPAWVLGCDTLVAVDNDVLEKPRDDRDARRMLRRLSGRWHHVLSGVALVPSGFSGRSRTGWRRTRVRFAALEARDVRWILRADEHMDKAGAYAVQGRAGVFIPAIAGSYSNVVGLPLDLVLSMLDELGYRPAGAISRPRR